MDLVLAFNVPHDVTRVVGDALLGVRNIAACHIRDALHPLVVCCLRFTPIHPCAQVSNSGPGNCGTITGSRLSQRVGVLDHGVDALLLVPVERLKHEWSLALSCASIRSRSKCLLRCRQSFACSWLCSFVSFPRAHPCCWVCSFTPTVGPLFSNPQCRPPITSSGFFASLSVILPSSPKVSGFLSWGSSATVMITQFVDLVQVLIVAAASCSHGDPRADCVFFTPCMTFSWRSMRCLANCSPVHVLTPWAFTCCAWSVGLTSTTLFPPSRAARGGLSRARLLWFVAFTSLSCSSPLTLRA